MRSSIAASLLVAVLAIGGCVAGSAGGAGGASTPSTSPSQRTSPSPASTCPAPPLPCRDDTYAWGLGINNGTTLPVTLVVNGKSVGVYAPGEAAPGNGIDPTSLPALPWTVEARAPTGRVLVSMKVLSAPLRTVSSGGSSSVSGTAARVDLSCGRLDIWAGPPLIGPAPGPGTPGDCAP